MTDAATVQIVLVGGPLDGMTHTIPAADVRCGRPWCFAPPYQPMPTVAYVPDDAIPPMPAPTLYLEYRPMCVEFAGWPMPSITDDGTVRYKYVGER